MLAGGVTGFQPSLKVLATSDSNAVAASDVGALPGGAVVDPLGVRWLAACRVQNCGQVLVGTLRLYTAVMSACASCGEDSLGGARFCPGCGAPLPERGGGLTEERKVVTVLFCDLVDSTARADGTDPEDVQATLGPYHARLRTELERFGATVEKFIGDAVMAVFGTPVAHEDDAERGVRAGLRILTAIAELNEARPGLDLEVRIGVATGEGLVRLGARPELGQGMVVGDVVNTTARLQTAAPPGGVVVGELTHRLTADEFDYQALAPVTVKGKAGPFAVWQATGTRARIAAEVLAAPATPFVGRAEELAALRSALGRSVRERAVQLVTITGEPGVGKSRLVRELAGVADAATELISWRQGHCLPYGDGVTFWALGEIIKSQAGILESDDEAVARAKLTTAVEAVTAEDRAWLIARLGPLVGLSGETGAAAPAQEESFTAWRRFLEAAAAEHPLVVVVEDTHWADPALLSFLEHLVDWAEGVALLVVVTARPELYAHAPAWGGGKRNATTLALRPLADAETAQLLAVLLDAAVLPAGAQAALLERAGGNPLYAEQFVRLISEQGLLTRRGRVVELRRSEDLPLPETVTALIAARLDTLPTKHKQLLADAAVLGRVFWSGGLLALGERDAAEVRLALRELARAELIRRVPKSTVTGQDEYAFWHALVRDVAYRSLPRKARAARHLAAARWLEQLAGDRVADHAELLAHHYLTALERTREAGDQAGASALTAPTARYLVMAGDRSMELDLTVAAGQYGRAAGLLPVTDPSRPAVLVKSGRANVDRGQLAEAEDLYREAIAGFEAQHDVAGAGEATSRLAIVTIERGGTAEGGRLLERAISLLEQVPPSDALAEAYVSSGGYHALAGRPEDALAAAGKVLALGQLAPKLRTWALEARDLARVMLGDVNGIEDAREAVRVARSLEMPTALVYALGNLAEDEWVIEGPVAALASYRESWDVAQRHGALFDGTRLSAESVRPLFDLGEWNELLARSQQLRTVLEAQGASYTLAGMEPYRAAVLLWRGELSAARALTEGVLPTAREIADLQVLVPALAVAALAGQATGNHPAALELAGEYEAAVRARPGQAGWYWGWWFLADLVRICVAAGELDRAAALAGDAQPALLRHRLSVLTVGAVLAEARGEAHQAAALYAKAAHGWQAYGHVLEHAQALLGLGRCRLALAGPGTEQALTEARQLFVRLQATPLLAETDHWLGQAVAQTS
jgi:class 3 adenylate cyclase/tetratricopeptide (TPR) repeat protein